MKRRGFLGIVVGGAVAAPVVALAKTRMPTVATAIKPAPTAKSMTATEYQILKPLSKAVSSFYDYDAHHNFEQHDIGKALGMESREMIHVKYEWEKTTGATVHYEDRAFPAQYHEIEFNYLQIVRTPVEIDGREWMYEGIDRIELEKQRTLRIHLNTIHQLLERGQRRGSNGTYHENTHTGGRAFFGSAAPGRVAYLRHRGLTWRTWSAPDSDVLCGEWLSDIGWAP